MKKCLSLISICSLLPILSISAHGREEHHQGEHNQTAKYHETHQNLQHHNKPENLYDHDAGRHYEQGLKTGYSSSSPSTVVVPTTPPPGSQPGMTDDSNALYHSYQQQPGH